tara:strand:- start:1204 stop:1887 length:684 start_codon:yes stop_codon:yes gene_type:complete
MNKKEKLVYFDVETTGLPTHRNLIPTMLDNQPHIVQLSWIIVEENQGKFPDSESLHYEVNNNDNPPRKYTEKDYIIKMPPGVSIPQSSTDIHKITNEISRDKGVNIDVVLKEFIEDISDATVVGAHNLSFDKQMVLIEASRLDLYGETAVPFKKVNKYCTMMNGTNLCKIPKYLEHSDTYTYKWPKLSELYKYLFDEEVDENVVLHNAIDDCRVGVKCYLKMQSCKS